VTPVFNTHYYIKFLHLRENNITVNICINYNHRHGDCLQPLYCYIAINIKCNDQLQSYFILSTSLSQRLAWGSRRCLMCALHVERGVEWQTGCDLLPIRVPAGEVLQLRIDLLSNYAFPRDIAWYNIVAIKSICLFQLPKVHPWLFGYVYPFHHSIPWLLELLRPTTCQLISRDKGSSFVWYHRPFWWLACTCCNLA